MFSLAIVVGCTTETGPAQEILGRWERVSLAGPGDPNEISGEYVEFREGGALLTLMRDGDVFWTVNSATYTVTSAVALEVLGTCWRGFESFECARTYEMRLEGDALTVTGDQAAEYRRVGELEDNPPATLAPPFPSAIP